MNKATVLAQIDNLSQEMVDALMSLIRIPAVAPENGGDGEEQKAQCLIQILESIGFDKIERYDAADERVSGGLRPNIVAYFDGFSDERRLWIVTHFDVVPPGRLDMWTVTEPFNPVVVNGCVFGRGSEDNGQSLVASVFALKALKLLGVRPSITVGLVFVADEEQGSKYGIQHLLDLGLFRQGDLVVVPDGGVEDGSFIEVAEKSILWFKLCVWGRQAHGSRPCDGLNAHRAGMQVVLALDKMLHRKYSKRDLWFDVPTSTFEPTQKDSNVEAVNIIPGEDVTYFDCRILPLYNVDTVLSDINIFLDSYAKKTGLKIDLEVLQKKVSPMLEVASSEIVLMLKGALKEVRDIDATVGGVGGGSCAAFFREQGIQAVVWSTINWMAHQPNEYAQISNMVQDAKIFALLAMG
ncbi:MAG: M20 family metallo-hydrolase [Candidatus Bathyarchaeota archaeon]|nr:M20 family metallo-hydrolase [Candidatus Termiticorpusculum sp.]